MHINILTSQGYDGTRVAVHAPQARSHGALEARKSAEEMVVRDLPAQPLPEGFDRVHVRRILRQEEELEPPVPREPRLQGPAFVPTRVVRDDHDASARAMAQKMPEKAPEVSPVDRGSQSMMDASANHVYGAEDMGFAPIAGPRPNADLLPTKAPSARERGIELDGRLVGKEQGQAPVMPGAIQQERQGPFFLARSRGFLPGSSCVGRKRRHPCL